MMSEIRELLAPVLRVLKDLGGQFVFSDEEGNEFVIVGREEFDKVDRQETQLELNAPIVLHRVDEDEITDLINRDIAMSRDPIRDAVPPWAGSPDAQAHPISNGAGDDLSIIADEYLKPPVVRVRFEPLRGDISPDLQE